MTRGNTGRFIYLDDNARTHRVYPKGDPNVMMRCSRCAQTKPETEFAWRNDGKTGFRKRKLCISCQSYCKSHNDRANAKKRRRDIIAMLDSIRTSSPCMDCGKYYPPFTMDFDHRPGEKKLANVSVLAARASNMQLILDEISKCDLVCANCHRGRTWRRRCDSEMERLYGRP